MYKDIYTKLYQYIKIIFHPISKSYSTNMRTHENILPMTYLLRKAVVMAAINCTEKRGFQYEGEKRGYDQSDKIRVAVKVII